jgi:uncharacterized protein YegL
MSDFDQQPFELVEFIDNPEPRCPVILLLDTSYSMSGEKIDALNDGLLTFREEIKQDSLAMKRVEVLQVTFGPVRILGDFVTADAYDPPQLQPEGSTPMGAAIESALEQLRRRKDSYRQAGVSYYRPWVFLITDGASTDDLSRAIASIVEGERKKEFNFFAVGVEGANMAELGRLSVRDPLKLKGLAFRELFLWLSSSLSARSHSNPADVVQLASPSGWSEVG